jgi:hypothetical protein
MATEQRKLLADAVGISEGFLYQIATNWRGKRPSIDVITKLAAADSELSVAELVAEFSDRKSAQEAV